MRKKRGVGGGGLAESEYSRIHGHGGESRVDVFAERLARVAGESLGRVELVLATELVWREAVVLPHLVQVRLGGYHHARRFAVYEVLLPNTRTRRHQADCTNQA